MDTDRTRTLIVAGVVAVALIVVVAVLASQGDETAASPPGLSTTAGPALSASTAPSTSAVSAGFQIENLAEFDGSYTGKWDTESFGSGNAAMDIDFDPDAETLAVTFDLQGQLLESLITELAPTDGNVDVMGGVDAVFSESGTATGTGTLIGEYTMSVTNEGEVALNAPDVPGPHVDDIEVSGELEPDCFTLNYRIALEGTDIVLEGSIELCRTADGGIITDDGGTVVPSQTIAEYSVEVLDLSAVDPIPGTGLATGSLVFECADGRCSGSFGVGQIGYPDGSAQRGGFREFVYDPASETYSFDETFAGACEQERWYGVITPTGFDDRGPTGWIFEGGHDGSGNCGYELVYEMTGTRVSVAP